ncbi:MAG: FecR domain-containing protein [Flavobacteriaceae bacterium]
MQENYLAKWLNNELSEEELKEFKNSEEYASYQRILAASDQLEAPEFDTDMAWKDFHDRRHAHKPKVVKMRPIQKMMRIAAAIAVLFVISYFYFDSLNETISTQYAHRETVILPDASEVILNAGSEISFSKKGWDQQRNIELEGEAFFKVAEGKKFTVSTAAGTVTVLGTQFNVEQRDGFFEVSCYEGLVRVNFKELETQLPAGSSIVIFNGTVVEEKVAINESPSWVKDESSFKSIPFKFVLNELERQYDIEVVTDNIDTVRLFTGTFSNTNLKLALESISAPYQISYKFEGDQVLFYAEETP